MSTIAEDPPPKNKKEEEENNNNNDNDNQTKKKKKKKKERLPPPPCPPVVATAYLFVRGIVMGVLGVDPSDATIGLMQPTYIAESPTLSAKVQFGLGKKQGCGMIGLNSTSSSIANPQEVLLDTIQTAINNRLLSSSSSSSSAASSSSTITCCTMTKQEAVTRYGNSILNAGMKKTKDDAEVLVATIPGLIQCIPPAVPAQNLNGYQIIVEVGTHLQSQVTSTSKKAEVVMKFRVEPKEDDNKNNKDDDDDDVKVELVPMSDSPVPKEDGILKKEIRIPEGLELFQNIQKAAEEEAAKQQQQLEEMTLSEKNNNTTTDNDDEMVVNTMEVKGTIDYDKLVQQFGSQLIPADLLQRLEAQTVGKGRVPRLHRFLRRNIFFSHRGLDLLLQQVEKGQPLYLYTGRGPSSAAMHLGHLVPFLFTQWLQQAFDCPLVIQMTDDEKFLFKGSYTEEKGDNLMDYAQLTIENARDIIACGFDYNKTFLFSDLDYVGRMYPNIVRIWKAVTTNTIQGIFGFDGSSNIGTVAFPAIQAAPSFSSSFPIGLAGREEIPCLIPCAIDQDPYFRLTRDVAHKLVPKSHPLQGKPALIHSKFFPPLQGAQGKMSSSDTSSAIFLTDTPEQIQEKITKYAFSGGQETKALQEERGADLEADVSYQWLRFFLEDDEELAAIGQSYGTGQGDYWSTGAVKKRLIEVLQVLVQEHQERRAKITDDDVRQWMTERNILESK